MKISENNSGIFIQNAEFLKLDLCFDCGQAFRWENKHSVWHGVVSNHVLDIEQLENGVFLHNTTIGDFNGIWYDYFDLKRDYKYICNELKKDQYLKRAIDEFSGIRILNQEPWEVLCSFIISQNNNIPRIKGIIDRLCKNFGDDLGNNDFTFPDAYTISKLSLDDLSVLRAGFRSKYILDAAQKVAMEEIALNNLSEMPLEDARNELIKIKGVGNKVADCTLLYGCRHIEAFPVDVWVKRVMGELYENVLPECAKGYEGIAQQYLFHWRRNSIDFKKS